MLSPRSRQRIAGVHPDLVRVVELAAEGPLAFIVTEGVRTKERQAVLVTAGKSRTMNSRHLGPVGHAVDLAVVLGDGTISWLREDYKHLAIEIKIAALQAGVPVEWGGECFGPSFFDGPHWQLPWRAYPVVPNLQADEVSNV